MVHSHMAACEAATSGKAAPAQAPSHISTARRPASSSIEALTFAVLPGFGAVDKGVGGGTEAQRHR